MRYKLRTLLILLAIGPMVLAVFAGIWFSSPVLESDPFWYAVTVAIIALAWMVLVLGILAVRNGIGVIGRSVTALIERLHDRR